MSLLPVEGLASKRTSSCHLPVRARVIAWSGLGAADWARQGAGVEARAMKTTAASSEEGFIVRSAKFRVQNLFAVTWLHNRGHAGDARTLTMAPIYI